MAEHGFRKAGVVGSTPTIGCLAFLASKRERLCSWIRWPGPWCLHVRQQQAAPGQDFYGCNLGKRRRAEKAGLLVIAC